MNYKQKLGYMLLGAGIMAIGITIGQFVTPDIEAQQNGFFDEITCRGLTVVDQNGKTAIRLNTFLGANGVSILNKKGKLAIALSSSEAYNTVNIYDKNEKGAIVLSALEKSNEINIYDKNRAEAIALFMPRLIVGDNSFNEVNIFNETREGAIALRTGEGVNNIAVKDPEGKESFRFNAQPHRNDFIVYDKSSGAGIGFYSDSNEARQTTWIPEQEE